MQCAMLLQCKTEVSLSVKETVAKLIGKINFIITFSFFLSQGTEKVAVTLRQVKYFPLITF